MKSCLFLILVLHFRLWLKFKFTNCATQLIKLTSQHPNITWYFDSNWKIVFSLSHSLEINICRLRELTTAEIGKLVSVTGVVTRTSEVRPELLQGTFRCLECGGVIKNVEQQFKYTEVGFKSMLPYIFNLLISLSSLILHVPLQF